MANGRSNARRNLIHLFDGEVVTAEIQCYCLEEIAIEKLRAFSIVTPYTHERQVRVAGSSSGIASAIW
jgi:hypothetical protein